MLTFSLLQCRLAKTGPFINILLCLMPDNSTCQGRTYTYGWTTVPVLSHHELHILLDQFEIQSNPVPCKKNKQSLNLQSFPRCIIQYQEEYSCMPKVCTCMYNIRTLWLPSIIWKLGNCLKAKVYMYTTRGAPISISALKSQYRYRYFCCRYYRYLTIFLGHVKYVFLAGTKIFHTCNDK